MHYIALDRGKFTPHPQVVSKENLSLSVRKTILIFHSPCLAFELCQVVHSICAKTNKQTNRNNTVETLSNLAMRRLVKYKMNWRIPCESPPWPSECGTGVVPTNPYLRTTVKRNGENAKWTDEDTDSWSVQNGRNSLDYTERPCLCNYWRNLSNVNNMWLILSVRYLLVISVENTGGQQCQDFDQMSRNMWRCHRCKCYVFRIHTGWKWRWK